MVNSTQGILTFPSSLCVIKGIIKPSQGYGLHESMPSVMKPSSDVWSGDTSMQTEFYIGHFIYQIK